MQHWQNLNISFSYNIVFLKCFVYKSVQYIKNFIFLFDVFTNNFYYFPLSSTKKIYKHNSLGHIDPQKHESANKMVSGIQYP